MTLFHPHMWHCSGVPPATAEDTVKLVFFIMLSELEPQDRPSFWQAFGKEVAKVNTDDTAETDGKLCYFDALQGNMTATLKHVHMKWWDTTTEQALRNNIAENCLYEIFNYDRDWAGNADTGKDKEQVQQEWWVQGCNSAGWCSCWTCSMLCEKTTAL